MRVYRWLGVLILLVIVQAAVAAKKEPVEISAIKGYLFYTDSGKWSENIIDNKQFSLWNTIIGEGSNAGPADRMLVVVALLSQQDTGDLLKKPVHIKVSTAKKILADVEKSAGFFKRKQFNIPVLIEGVACEPVKVRVEIVGMQTAAVEKWIPFACGE